MCSLTHSFVYYFLLTHSLTYILTYLLTHLRTYLLTYLLTYILTHSLTYVPTYLPTYLLIYLLIYLLTYLLTYLHSYLYLLTYLLIQSFYLCFPLLSIRYPTINTLLTRGVFFFLRTLWRTTILLGKLGRALHSPGKLQLKWVLETFSSGKASSMWLAFERYMLAIGLACTSHGQTLVQERLQFARMV